MEGSELEAETEAILSVTGGCGSCQRKNLRSHTGQTTLTERIQWDGRRNPGNCRTWRSYRKSPLYEWETKRNDNYEKAGATGLVAIIYMKADQMWLRWQHWHWEKRECLCPERWQGGFSKRKCHRECLKEGELRKQVVIPEPSTCCRCEHRESANERCVLRSGRSAIPRGGAGWSDLPVQKNATVPGIQTGTGICHVLCGWWGWSW